MNLSLEWTVMLYFGVKNILALIQRDREFDFQLIRDNQKTENMEYLLQKHHGTGTLVPFLKKYHR